MDCDTYLAGLISNIGSWNISEEMPRARSGQSRVRTEKQTKTSETLQNNQEHLESLENELHTLQIKEKILDMELRIHDTKHRLMHMASSTNGDSSQGHTAPASCSTTGSGSRLRSTQFTDLKSGYDTKCQMTCKQFVRWPHGHLGPIITTMKDQDINPESISLEVFLYGYFMILNLDQLSAIELKGQIEHGRDLLHHKIVHGWPSARRFHNSALWSMEYDDLGWQDKEKLKLLSLTAAGDFVPSRSCPSSDNDDTDMLMGAE